MCVGHIDFMLFMSISFAFAGQRKCYSQWNMDLGVHNYIIIKIGHSVCHCDHTIRSRCKLRSMINKKKKKKN